LDTTTTLRSNNQIQKQIHVISGTQAGFFSTKGIQPSFIESLTSYYTYAEFTSWKGTKHNYPAHKGKDQSIDAKDNNTGLHVERTLS